MNCFRVDKKENRLLDFSYSNNVRHAKECIALQKLSVALRLKVEILLRKGYGLDDRYNCLCYITNRHYTISYCGHYGILVWIYLNYPPLWLNEEWKYVICKQIRWKYLPKITL